MNSRTSVTNCQKPTIFKTSDWRELDQITWPEVMALIYSPNRLPSWFNELQAAVREGHFMVNKTIIEPVDASFIRQHLPTHLPMQGISNEVRHALIEDINKHVILCAKISCKNIFQLRYMTAKPNQRHGFHVDLSKTTQDCRVLRVYGSGTEYVEPSNVKSMCDFYSWVVRYERNAQQMSMSERQSNNSVHKSQKVNILDTGIDFLHSPTKIHKVPTGATVVIRTVPKWAINPIDIISGHAEGWIHRSPSVGSIRFLVSITSIS